MRTPVELADTNTAVGKLSAGPKYGTSIDAHPSTIALLRFFASDHLPSRLRAVAAPFEELAYVLAMKLDGAELTAGLRKLLESKDCCVRAAL